MPLIDLILNIAAMLLWLNWLAVKFDPLAKTPSVSIIGTLTKANPEPQRRWVVLVMLAVFLWLRAVIYWQICGTFHWTLKLDLGMVALPFRSDFFWRMELFSLLSFLLAFGTFYLWLLAISIVNTRVPDTDSRQRWVRVHLRWVERWPVAIKLVLPIILAALAWLAVQPLLASAGMVPKVRTTQQLFEQAAIIGAGSYLAAKYLIVGILLLHMLNSYVYFGNQSYWGFVNTTARNLLYPLSWLPARVGKFDFLPVIGIALVFFAAETFSRLPTWFYRLLPF